MGVTGYWFGKEYDGARAVWTGKHSQVRIGFGDFSHSTGITDSAYTHAIYTDFLRVPTVDEFLGTTLDTDGSKKELIVDNAADTVNFYQQLKVLRDREQALAKRVEDAKTKAEELTNDIWTKENLEGAPESVLQPLREELARTQASIPVLQSEYERQLEPLRREQFNVVRRMQEIVVKANPWPSYEEELDVIIADSGMKWSEYVAEFQKHGWWDCKAINPPFWGTYRRYETGYLPQKAAGGVIGNYGLADAINTPGFGTPTKKMELWNTTIETFMPDSPRDVLPEYIEPPMSPKADPERCAEYPFIATSGRRIPVYFHSEHRQLPWCREQWPAPRVEINPEDAAELGIEQGDWVWIETPEGKIRQTADLYYGIKTGVVNLEHQWWFPELDQADKGFNLSCCNCLVRTGVGYQDRISGASYLRAYPVKIYKATAENSPFGNPCPCDHNGNEIIHDASDPRLKKWTQNYDIREEA